MAVLEETYVERYYPWPNDEDSKGCELVQFRLTYDGDLPSDSGERASRVKHEIRKVLHKQLAELWRTDPFLKQFVEGRTYERVPSPDNKTIPVVLSMANKYARFGFRFLLLVRKGKAECSIDVLFLRRSGKQLISQGGDVDNRIKTLLDGLSMPQYQEQLKGFSPDVDEDPFYCLLEDDGLITQIKVTADKLLTPLEKDGFQNNVRLIIGVEVLINRGGADAWDAFS